MPLRPVILAVFGLFTLAACDNPLVTTVTDGARAVTDPAYAQQRGAVEVFVKVNHQAILTDMATGGGPNLTRAFDLARVPEGDRIGRRLQMEGDRGLYEQNPEALISALMVYGS